MSLTYLRLEILRAFRVPRFYILTVAMPLVLYLLLGSAYGTDAVDGAPVAAWFMVSMSVFGAMGGSTTVGGRIAVEREVGWTRQLRLTPLSGRAYLAGKAATAFLVSIPSLLLLYLAGRVLKGVHLPLSTWAAVFGWTLLGVLPFVALGILLGHLVKGETLGPLSGALFTFLALLGGIWFPVDQMPTWLADVAKATPSYWLAEAGREPLTGHNIGLHGLLILAAWTVGLGAAAIRRFQRGTRPV
jgi:ABC-2 type transport system permease protein